jgi:hypothetical protein
MTSERSETSPPGGRFVRYAAVFLLAVVVLRNGWSLWARGTWPSDAPWSAITLSALGLSFLIARPGDRTWSVRRVVALVLVMIGLVSATIAMVVQLRAS